jgi:hypothetical protein
MNQGLVSLPKDERWNFWLKNSYEYFQNTVSAVKLSASVPEEVLERFEIIRKLILHSYFVYEFLDIAMEKALLTFELALKNRFKEKEGEWPVGQYSSLCKLIKWGSDNGLFEEDEPAIQYLRELRNDIAHPKDRQQYGHLSLFIVHNVAEVINGLYEDVDLRKSRKEEEKEVDLKLTDFIQDGAELESEDVRLILFKACLLYYNNKIMPEEYYFLFWPIFNPIPDNENTDVCLPMVICSHSWKHTAEGFVVKDSLNEQEIRLKRIVKNENINKFRKWKTDIEMHNPDLMFEINIRLSEIRSEIRNKQNNIA